MKKLKLLWRILKSVGADKILIGFLLFLLLAAYLFQILEPDIYTYGEGIWYSFNVVTTVGFGDYHAVTTLGRILTMVVGVYGILVVAFIPGILVSFYLEFMKIKEDQSIVAFMEKLERLDTLSKEELKELSEKIKKRKYKL